MPSDQEVNRSAAQEPLTDAAKVHLHAAAIEVEEGFSELDSVLALARSRLERQDLGTEVVLSQQEAFELDRALSGARELAYARMVAPVFKRAQGNRPHAIGAALVLHGEDLERRAYEVALICSLAVVDMSDSDEVHRKTLEWIGLMAEHFVHYLEDRTGEDLYERVREEASEKAAKVKDQIRGQVENEGEAGKAGGEEIPDPVLRALALAAQAVGLYADEALLSADEPYTARKLFGAVYDRVDPVYQRLAESNGLDVEQVDERASEELREIGEELRAAALERLAEGQTEEPADVPKPTSNITED